MSYDPEEQMWRRLFAARGLHQPEPVRITGAITFADPPAPDDHVAIAEQENKRAAIVKLLAEMLVKSLREEWDATEARAACAPYYMGPLGYGTTPIDPTLVTFISNAIVPALLDR